MRVEKISKTWDINFIYEENRGNFSVIVLVAVLCQSLMSKTDREREIHFKDQK